jgi:hypothetical protein
MCCLLLARAQKDRSKSPVDIQQKLKQFWEGEQQIEQLFDNVGFFGYFKSPNDAIL